MANKYDVLVSSIVDLVGGKENIRSFAPVSYTHLTLPTKLEV